MPSLFSDDQKVRQRLKGKTWGQILSNEIQGIWTMKYLIMKAKSRLHNLAGKRMMSCELESCSTQWSPGLLNIKNVAKIMNSDLPEQRIAMA